MNITVIPIIVILTYLLIELVKCLFINNDRYKKIIPILSALIGGGISVVMYITNQEIMQVSNIWIALEIGIVSGSSVTGTNQIIKKIFGGTKDDN